MFRTRPLFLAAVAGAVVFACAEIGPEIPAANLSHTEWAPEVGHFTLCKVGTDATFDVVIDGVPSTVSLLDGECTDLVTIQIINGAPSADVNVTVTEVAASGVQLDEISVTSVVFNNPPTTTTMTGTNTYSSSVDDDRGEVVTFENSPVGIGRMTGGGRQIRVDGVAVSRGLTLHCDIQLSNNLEINWAGGNKWHLDKPITSAQCVDDPNISPTPPAAPFDTFIGEGTGRLNRVDGSVVRFTFVDAGEPGRNDHATIEIWAPGDDPDSTSPVLSVSGYLDNGNLQAHFDQPHS